MTVASTVLSTAGSVRGLDGRTSELPLGRSLRASERVRRLKGARLTLRAVQGSRSATKVVRLG